MLLAEKVRQDANENISDFIEESSVEEAISEVNPKYIGQDIVLELSCGYGQNIPQAIKMGILKHVYSMYELNENSLDPVEEVRNLYLPYRVFKI